MLSEFKFITKYEIVESFQIFLSTQDAMQRRATHKLAIVIWVITKDWIMCL